MCMSGTILKIERKRERDRERERETASQINRQIDRQIEIVIKSETGRKSERERICSNIYYFKLLI